MTRAPKTAWDDDEIEFSGMGSAYPLTEYSEPRKTKKRHPVGFAPPSTKARRGVS